MHPDSTLSKGSITDLVLNPAAFFRSTYGQQDAPAWVFLVFGLGYGIDKVDQRLVKYDLQGKLDQIDFLNYWSGFWLISSIDIIGGYIVYLIGGWFYNVRLKWANGSSDFTKSRYLYLYSGIISSSVIILSALIETCIQKRPYEPDADTTVVSLATFVAILTAVYYSVYVSYQGVLAVTDADPKKARIWFFYLPILIYTLSYIAIFGVIISMLIS
ncbi:hypothetical protein SAMN00120144_2450 [Hymenobacter roseosalivarius DSM 11622]|uniref:Yip1 domain-containing protein n=1 Tax=Hymenobacter roseosalivarius DSM 11622 TaxID=645990 RepID=A0A1W1VE47_9BACT|nr:YIP1 family protein [Hymenobacter roseosalivarius]SMB91717.1 hypothetical protein SAMN00120144_2450 [Hymenobacter roseosalivarius DSM 11622]